jgi:hypothetical protein
MNSTLQVFAFPCGVVFGETGFDFPSLECGLVFRMAMVSLSFKMKTSGRVVVAVVAGEMDLFRLY